MRLTVWSSAAALAVVLLATPPALPCSMCRCGDPTFAALGTDVFVADKWRATLDIERFEKSSAADLEDLPTRRLSSIPTDVETERRSTLGVAYSIGERVTLVGRLPFSQRKLAGPGGTDEASGIGDPELLGVVRVWGSPATTPFANRAWISAIAGVKTDWGRDDAQVDGVRADEHLQPGTGAFDLTLGLSAVKLLGTRTTIYGSVLTRRPRENDFGYRYGNVWLGNVGFERKLSTRLDGVLEINLRDAGFDSTDFGGGRDDHSGGAVAYLSPRLLVDLSAGFVARLGVQVPIYENLNGEQDEKLNFSVGIAATF